jgi:hypothetical protein
VEKQVHGREDERTWKLAEDGQNGHDQEGGNQTREIEDCAGGQSASVPAEVGHVGPSGAGVQSLDQWYLDGTQGGGQEGTDVRGPRLVTEMFANIPPVPVSVQELFDLMWDIEHGQSVSAVSRILGWIDQGERQ